MRSVYWFVTIAELLTRAFAECLEDNCVVDLCDAPFQTVSSHCENLLRVTVTSSTNTVVETLTLGTTEKSTSTTTSIRTAEPSKRWQDQHQVLEILLRRRPMPTATVESTSAPQHTSSYALPYFSIRALSSACTCLGISQVTVTTPTLTIPTVRFQETTTVATIAPFITTERHVIFRNSFTGFANSTGLKYANSTASNTKNSSSILISSLSSASAISSSSRMSLSRHISPPITPSSVPLFSSTTIDSAQGQILANTTNKALFTNNTSIQRSVYGSAIFMNSTSLRASVAASSNNFPLSTTNSASVLNTTSTGHYLNTTSIPALLELPSASIHLNATTTPAWLNATKSPAGLNATRTGPYLNTTSGSVMNATVTPGPLNATKIPEILNMTRTAPYLNTTRAPFLNTTLLPSMNTTIAPFANTTRTNSTAVSFSNTSTPVSTPTPSETLACGSTPFLVQVSQPEGLFDGWWLKVSGNMIIFTSSANYSSKFTVGNPGYLCTLDYLGQNGDPTIAIVESKEGLTGSALYFIDKERIIDDGPLSQQGYGVLECDADNDLNCSEGDMFNWVGCGLGLGISSDPGQNVVVDAWNCTIIGLNVVYE